MGQVSEKQISHCRGGEKQTSTDQTTIMLTGWEGQEDLNGVFLYYNTNVIREQRTLDTWYILTTVRKE